VTFECHDIHEVSELGINCGARTCIHSAAPRIARIHVPDAVEIRRALSERLMMRRSIAIAIDVAGACTPSTIIC